MPRTMSPAAATIATMSKIASEFQHGHFSALAISVALGLLCTTSHAKAAEDITAASTTLSAVQVNASRLSVDPRDVPASISVVDVDPGHSGQPGVNLSEALVGVPGVLARDRQNYAQDEQFSIRGFGARSTFGVRSIRLYVDGIPATLPDGQGQVSAFDLHMGGRLEVLRGPFSVLYGNASGGVVQLWTAPGLAVPQTTLGLFAGSDDSFQYSADTRGKLGTADYNVAVSQFLSGGYRVHSRVNRQTAHARFTVPLDDHRRVTVVVDRFDQPRAQDPMGLTWAQYQTDPRQASPAALQYNTRKTILQNQLGVVYAQEFSDADRIQVSAYGGHRDIEQFQSIPKATQANPLQPGGVVSPDTTYAGVDLRWTHDGQFLGRATEFVLGVGGDGQWQRRLGYQNFVGGSLGVLGTLRRDENDNVNNADLYAQEYWYFADRWSLLLGIRHDAVHFQEFDHYVAPENPNDSGHVNYQATTPVVGLMFRPLDNLQLYGSFGRGFETPSYTELGYRSDGLPGLAFNLRAAHSNNQELGMKWQPTAMLDVEAAAFRADTRDELAVSTNENGRSTYQNVGDTRRQGVELSFNGKLTPAWQVQAAVTHLQAVFRSGFLACISSQCAVPSTPITAGSRIPGVPSTYGSLHLQHGLDTEWREGLTLSGASNTVANDINTARAPGYGLVGVDVSYTFDLGEAKRLQLSARVDNLADSRYIGSVIVNDSNGRYFEPGPDRSYMIGAQLTF